MADQKLRIQLTAIDRTQRAFATVNNGLMRVKNSIFSVQTAVTALVAGAGIQRFAEQIDRLAKTSRALGLTVNELQSLQFAAEQTGVSSEELNKSLERFNRNVSEASLGTGIAKRSFDDLGVSVTDQNGKLRSTDEILLDVSDALRDVENPADRVRMAFDLFGRSGTKLINTLSAGSDELVGLRNEFNNITIAIDQQTAGLVEIANDRFNRIFTSLASVFNNFGASIIDGMSKAVAGLTMIFYDLGSAIASAFGDEDYAEELQRLKRGLINSEIAALAAQEQLKDLNGTLDDGTMRLDITSSAADNLRETLGGVREATKIAGKGLKEYGEIAQDVRSNLLDASLSGVRRLEDSLVDMAMGAKTAQDAFKDMARSIISDLVRIGIQRQITGQIADFIFGGFGGTPSGIASPTPRPRAIGGSVQAGQTYMVGERGKELFVPNQSGAIIPNDKMAGGGVVVNQTINLSAGVSQTVRAEVMNMMPQIANAAKGAVIDAKRRGGTFGSAFGA